MLKSSSDCWGWGNRSAATPIDGLGGAVELSTLADDWSRGGEFLGDGAEGIPVVRKILQDEDDYHDGQNEFKEIGMFVASHYDLIYYKKRNFIL